jgi:phage terminase Nu1 subunit (DNA packaging protein)
MAIVSDRELTVTAIAKHFDVSRQTIYTWRKEGMPVSDDLPVLESWVAQHKPGDADDDDLQIQRLKAEIHKLKQDGRGKELKNDVLEGKLVPLDSVLTQVSELTLRVKHRLEAIPDEAASEFPPEIRAIAVELMRDKIFLVLTEMSQWQLEGE